MSEWHDGLFLGPAGTSSEVYIGTADGVYKTNDIRRHGDHRYASDLVDGFMTSIQQSVDPEVEEPPIAFAPAPPPAAREHIPQEHEQTARRIRLHPADFERFGYTPGCAGCSALRQHSAGMGTGERRNHTEACRTRMEELLIQTPEGRARKQREVDRREQEFQQRVNAEDERQQARDRREQAAGQPQGEPGVPSQAAPDSREPAQQAPTTPRVPQAPEPQSSRPTDGEPAARRRRTESSAHEPQRRPEEDDNPEAKRARVGSEATGPDGGNGDAGNTLSFLSTRDPHQDAVDDDGEMQILSAVLRGVDIMEVYSPVRVGKICKKYHLNQEKA